MGRKIEITSNVSLKYFLVLSKDIESDFHGNRDFNT